MIFGILIIAVFVCKVAALSLTTQSTGTMLKPLILLDVDGVINALDGGNKKRWKDVEKKVVNKYDIYYSPTVVNKINAWSKVAEVRWLTTWDENARRLLAPALGLNEFELARDPDLMLSKDQAAFDCIQMTPSRLLVWIDDEVLCYSSNPKAPVPSSFWRDRDRTLLISPAEFYGLEPLHLKKIDAFLARSPREIDNITASRKFAQSVFDKGHK